MRSSLYSGRSMSDGSGRRTHGRRQRDRGVRAVDRSIEPPGPEGRASSREDPGAGGRRSGRAVLERPQGHEARPPRAPAEARSEPAADHLRLRSQAGGAAPARRRQGRRQAVLRAGHPEGRADLGGAPRAPGEGRRPMKAKTKSWKQIEKKLFTREEVAEAERFAEREILEMNLRELRQAAGKTQEQVARAAKMKQSELSRAERREDHLLSTLRRYVKGLGGDLEVVARVRGRVVRLRGV